MVVLKLLSDAERDGDRVLAVLRGSAVRQDGRTNGIMAPCGQAQQHVMTAALRTAGIEPETVRYVEAHGTGTPVGDPMEAAAIGAVYGRTDEPLLIGSVKSNIGHLEGAAGIAGVIKAVLALGRAEIPPTRISTEVNPDIDWSGLGIRVSTTLSSWPQHDHPRRAGVSGFGYGGTVAHVVLEQPPVPTGNESADSAGLLFPVSARSRAALGDRASALADLVEQGADVAAVGHTLAVRRSHLDHRAVVVAEDRDALIHGLRELAAGRPSENVVTGSPIADDNAVWVFSGHGSQWAGMGAELLDSEPAFTAQIDALAAVFTAEIGFSPREALIDGTFTQVDRIQAMIFATQLGLAALWRSRGTEPSAVIGHSVGEIAAAVTAGVLSWTDGARLICRRSLLLRRVAGQGGMAMVARPFADVAARLGDRQDVVAAIESSPVSTVISGDRGAVAALAAEWSADGVGVRTISSDVAFHSPHMDALLDDLGLAAGELRPRSPQVPIYSTALSDPRAPMTADGDYWRANLRQPVRLAAAVTAAVEDGHRAFLEISPHPVIGHSVHETLAALGVEDGFVGATLRRDRPQVRTFHTAVAAAHCAGIGVDWRILQPAGGITALPVYPWRHRKLWHATGTRGGGRGHDVAAHSLLGDGEPVVGRDLRLWRTVLDDRSRPYPGSHALNGVEIVPAAVLVQTFLDAATRDGVTPGLADLSMRHPLMTAGTLEIQVVRDGPGLRVGSRTPDEDRDTDHAWLVNAEASIADSGPRGTFVDADDYRLEPADPHMVHRRLADVGVPSTGFPWTVLDVLSGNGVVRARVRNADVSTWASVLDAVMSIAPAVFVGLPVLRMVVHINAVHIHQDAGPLPETTLIEVVLNPDESDTVDAVVGTETGQVLATLSGLRYPVIDAPVAPVEADPDQAGPSVSFDDLSGEPLRERVLEEVRSQIATEMRLAATDLHLRRPLSEQGLDSVMTVVIRRRLEKRIGRGLSANVFWQRPSVTAIVDHLVELISDDAESVRR